MKHKSLALMLVVTSALFVTGCGGGGMGNRVPTANAGPDATQFAGVSSSLDASASSDPDSDPLTFAWTLSSKPDFSTATISNGSSKVAALTPDVAGTYSVSLVVNDGKVSSAPVTKLVTAKVPVDDFVKVYTTGTCKYMLKLYVIDQHIVYARAETTDCSDSSPDSMFESVLNHPVCSGAILGRPRGCTDDRYTSIFNTVSAHYTEADLGLGSSHKVERVY